MIFSPSSGSDLLPGLGERDIIGSSGSELPPRECELLAFTCRWRHPKREGKKRNFVRKNNLYGNAVTNGKRQKEEADMIDIKQ